MRVGLVVLGARMARRGPHASGVFVRAVACIALVQLACLLVFGHYVVADELAARVNDRHVASADGGGSKRSVIIEGADQAANGETVARYVVMTEVGDAPAFGGATVGQFTGCVISPALRAAMASEPLLAARTCGSGARRVLAEPSLLRSDELVALVYLRGPLPPKNLLGPRDTYLMGRDLNPSVSAHRHTNARNDLLLLLAPVLLAGVVALRSALGALQRRDAPWAQSLVELGANRRGVALFTAALTVPAVLAASVVAALLAFGAWQARVYQVIFGGQPVGAADLARRCVWVLPVTWLLVLLASIVPTRTKQRVVAQHSGRARALLLLVLPVAAALVARKVFDFDSTQRLLSVYLVALALLATTPMVLRWIAGASIPKLLERRPPHALLVPWRGLLGSLRGFSRAAAPLLAGSFVFTLAIAATGLLEDTQTQFVRRQVETKPLGTGFRADIAHSSLPKLGDDVVEVRAVRIYPPKVGSGLLVAPCRDFERAIDAALPCSEAGVRLSYADFVTPSQTVLVPGRTKSQVTIETQVKVSEAMAALIGEHTLQFGSWRATDALAAWGPDAEITETVLVGGPPAAVQRARTLIYERVPTALLQSPGVEWSESAASYQIIIRRLQSLAVLVMAMLAAGHVVGAADQLRRDLRLERDTTLLGAPASATRRWRLVRQLTEMATIVVASSVLAGLFGLAATQLDVVTDVQGYTAAYLLTLAALLAILGAQTLLSWLTTSTDS